MSELVGSDVPTLVLAFFAGVVVAVVTAPVGVSGAVFLLPVQLDVLRVPSPAVTPTNLIFNLVATPGALWRYWQARAIDIRLTGRLLIGTVPGVVIGSVVRVYAAPGDRVFRALAAAVLLPLGVWLCTGRTVRARPRWTTGRPLAVAGLLVGVVGGIYGIGGGSLLGPMLVGAGLSVVRVAPAALASTLVTSSVGVASYALLSLIASGPVRPEWIIGLACGLGGLVGGYVGAWLQPHLPEALLRALLGAIAAGLAALYILQATGLLGR
jgi:uncharacterized membrane protein YfcA